MLNFTRHFKSSIKSRKKATKLKNRLLTLGHNDDGVAAVEFAILAPIMIALYFGLVEISMIIQADKMTSHASNVAGDLATQVSNMDENDIQDIFQATLSTMSLRSDQFGDVKIELISYKIDSSGDFEELGRATLNGGYGGAAYNPADIGDRLLTATSGAVVSRVRYDYQSVTSDFVSDLTVLDETFILKPRQSADIPFSLNGSYQLFTCTATNTITVTC